MDSIENIITENIEVWSSAIKQRNTQGRGSSKRQELYGVQKLRELILELAVRGLLVPQDSSDEPASVLLKKIASEKEQSYGQIWCTSIRRFSCLIAPLLVRRLGI